MRKHIRKIVSTALIAVMLFFAPSMMPVRAIPLPCGTIITPWLQLPNDTAFAAIIIPCPPAAPIHAPVPAWFWAGFACPASIIMSGIVANFRDNRQLTYAEAWTCGLLYWFGLPPQQQVRGHH
jgi:hypothetical protein